VLGLQLPGAARPRRHRRSGRPTRRDGRQLGAICRRQPTTAGNRSPATASSRRPTR
jgi:hypothetical protein